MAVNIHCPCCHFSNLVYPENHELVGTGKRAIFFFLCSHCGARLLYNDGTIVFGSQIGQGAAW